jgi:NapC/NirT cytochrome c family protein
MHEALKSRRDMSVGGPAVSATARKSLPVEAVVEELDESVFVCPLGSSLRHPLRDEMEMTTVAINQINAEAWGKDTRRFTDPQRDFAWKADLLAWRLQLIKHTTGSVLNVQGHNHLNDRSSRATSEHLKRQEKEVMGHTRSFLNLLSMSRLSIFGAIIVTTTIGADAMLILGELLIFESNPYIGIVAYVIFPGAAAFGLTLIPIGMLIRMRKLRRQDPVGRLVRHLSRPHVLRFILTLTMVNLVVFAFVGYRSFHVMESPEFCGEVCHEVMIPEFTVYKRSAHAEVACVECHIGSGVGWFIKSKLDGTRQLAGVVLGNYSRPIETPIHNMRPARDVCEVCHRPESLRANRIKVIEQFESDEDNTRTFTVLNLRLGSVGGQGSDARGIHWHASRDHEIRYWATDRRRENIVRVELTEADGSTRVWTRPGTDADEAGHEPESTHESVRVMDCIDCHNRPTHVYLPPDQALDEAMSDGRIDATIPWIRSMAEVVLTRDYETRDLAMEGIAELPDLYRQRYPEYGVEYEDAILSVVPVLQDIHRTFVYPSMKIGWNTYPSLIGHPTAETAGCFRCHDGVLVDPNGKQISNDCRSCHFVLADKDQDPMILRMLEDR